MVCGRSQYHACKLTTHCCSCKTFHPALARPAGSSVYCSWKSWIHACKLATHWWFCLLLSFFFQILCFSFQCPLFVWFSTAFINVFIFRRHYVIKVFFCYFTFFLTLYLLQLKCAELVHTILCTRVFLVVLNVILLISSFRTCADVETLECSRISCFLPFLFSLLHF